MDARTLTLLLSLAGACARGGDERLGVQPATLAVDVTRLDDADGLARALLLDGAARDRGLGAHRREVTRVTKVESAGKPVEALEEHDVLDSDARGGVHVLRDNSHGYGMEAVLADGRFFVRPRYQRFVERAREPGEVERLRRLVEDTLGADVELLRRWIALARSEAGGRVSVKLTLRATPAAVIPEARGERKWRESVVATALDGELTLDAKSGAVVAARLDSTYRFEREGKPFVVTLQHQEKTGAAEAITAPGDAVSGLERPRPLVDRQALLGERRRAKSPVR